MWFKSMTYKACEGLATYFHHLPFRKRADWLWHVKLSTNTRGSLTVKVGDTAFHVDCLDSWVSVENGRAYRVINIQLSTGYPDKGTHCWFRPNTYRVGDPYVSHAPEGAKPMCEVEVTP